MAVKQFGLKQSFHSQLLQRDGALLVESVHRSIKMAREQVLRSAEIVSRSHEIVGKTRLTMARAGRIQRGVHEPAINPWIEYAASKS